METSGEERRATEKEPAKKQPPKELPGKNKTPRKDAPGKDRGVEKKRVMGFATIVVALDGTAASEHARAWAGSLARMHDARLVVVHVSRIPISGVAPGAYGPVSAPTGAAAASMPITTVDVEAIVEGLRAGGVRAEGETAGPAVGSPSTAVLDVVARRNADLLVVGTEGRSGLTRLLLGSTAEELLREAPCPVLVVPTAADHTTRELVTVLVPTDLSDAAASAYPVAERVLAPVEGTATLVLLSAGLEPLAPLTLEEVATQTAENLRTLADSLRRPGLEVDVVIRSEDAVDAIVAEAERRPVDLVVMGTHGRSGLRRVAFGSVTEQVLRTAPCPVLTVRPDVPQVAAR